MVTDKNKSGEYYRKNRDRIIKRQREYDRTHKEIKKAYDLKRRIFKNKNQIRTIQDQSRKKHFQELYNKYGGCQICKSKVKLEIHHINYTTDIQDLLLLCQECHKKHHRKYKE